jgi:hypothetical protein
VLAAIAAAARRRRAREASRLLWRVAPIVAATTVCVALYARWKYAPPIIPVTLLIGFAAGWVVYSWVQRRFVRITDSTAAAIDDDARLGGELRSAAWFATREHADPWAAFHVDRAAERLESIDLGQLYPPVAARPARVATGVLAALVAFLVATFPERPYAVQTFGATAPDTVLQRMPPGSLDGLPIELPRELLDLLEAIESGTLPPPDLADAAMQGTLAQLQALKDPKALAALARALAADRNTGNTDAAIKELADRTRRDAAMMPPSDIRDALDELSKKLSEPGRKLDTAGLEELEESDDAEAQKQGGASLDAPPPQSSRDASAIAGLGMVTLTNQEASDPNAPPGIGAGGTADNQSVGAVAPKISEALRQEIIEAHEEDASADVQTETRRRTERGRAATTFTGSAAGAFDGARASAPPPVPETRRAGIQTYFTRKQ